MTDATSLPVAAGVAAAKAVAPQVLTLLQKAFEKSARKIGYSLSNLCASYEDHLKATYTRCGAIKTILHPDEPVDLLSIYVQTKFKCQQRNLDDFAVIDEIRRKKRAVICGTAGGGKLFF